MRLMALLRDRRSRWKIIGGSLSILVAAYVGVCADFYFRQESYLLEPQKDPTGMEASPHQGEGREFVLPDLPEDDGEIHYRKYATTASPPQGTVFYLHGNRGDMDRCEWEIDFLLDLGYDVWTMDYRGFGQSSGTNSEVALKEDAWRVFDSIKPADPNGPIIIWGRSFGSGIAASVAARAEQKPKMLILETPYWSLADVVSKRFPFLPSALLRYRLPTHEFLMSAGCPIHLIHGTEDEKIPANSSDRLHDLEGIATTRHLVEGGQHNLRDERTLGQFKAIAASIMK